MDILCTIIIGLLFENKICGIVMLTWLPLHALFIDYNEAFGNKDQVEN